MAHLEMNSISITTTGIKEKHNFLYPNNYRLTLKRSQPSMYANEFFYYHPLASKFTDDLK